MKWQTRSGRPYREAGINPDANHFQQRVGWYQAEDGIWYSTENAMDGKHRLSSALDLVPVPETVERWFVAWRNRSNSDQFDIFEHEADARNYADRLRRHEFPPKWVADPIRVEWTLPTEEKKA